MTWIKISDNDGGIYAEIPEPDPRQVVSISEIDAEIAVLTAGLYEGDTAKIGAWAVEHYYELQIFQVDTQAKMRIGDLQELKRQLSEL